MMGVRCRGGRLSRLMGRGFELNSFDDYDCTVCLCYDRGKVG
jgi:hypothetical protein